MITRAFALAALAILAALPALADPNPNVAYQSSLLSRPLSPADKAVCDSKVGAQNSGSDAYAACRVTRLLLADVANGREQGFPPLADIKYCVGNETAKILDVLTKFGG